MKAIQGGKTVRQGTSHSIPNGAAGWQTGIGRRFRDSAGGEETHPGAQTGNPGIALQSEQLLFQSKGEMARWSSNQGLAGVGAVLEPDRNTRFRRSSSSARFLSG